MTTYKPFSPKRQLIDANNVVAKAQDYVVLCVSAGGLDAARQLLGTRGRWRSTYYDDVSDSGYVLPSDAMWDDVLDVVEGFLADTDGQMTCDIIASLDRINDSIAALSACCSQGSGGVSPDTPFSTFEDTGSNYPDGFADRPEYDQHKCDAAQWFINQWQQDVGWLKTIDVAALGATGLAAGLLIPGVNVAAFVGVLLLLVALGVFVSDLQAIEDWLDANNDDILCAVYDATNSASALSAVVDLVEASSLTSNQQTAANYLITPAAINRVFEDANVPDLSADCSGCGESGCATVYMNLGSYTPPNGFTSVLTTVPDPDRHNIRVSFNYDDELEEYCGAPVTIESITINSGQPDSTAGNQAYRLFAQNGTTLYSGDSQPTLPFANVGKIDIYDDVSPQQEITATIVWS
jgi:hypothetical protein